jgi:type II secretory pathway pseudopilin PulG
MLMQTFSSIDSKASSMNITLFWSRLRMLALALMVAVPLAAAAAPQETFATPEAAVDALMAALKADSDQAMLAIFGEEHKGLIIESDRAGTSATRARIFAAMQTLRVLQTPTPDRRVLVIGDEAWPVPIPLVRTGDRWRFATEEGADEIVNRRVGGNERNAIHVLRAYIDAQRTYATRDRDGDGVLQYAQKLASTPGKHDGLYWPADVAKGEEASPFGPLVAESSAYREGRAAGAPYRGYHFRILTRQGKDAPGGAYSYVINGRMIAGFAMVAYPAEYGRSGVMTFVVSHNGKVYEKDLGKNSTAIAAKMAAFDLGSGWKEVAP